jgi:hypothetical protein
MVAELVHLDLLDYGGKRLHLTPKGKAWATDLVASSKHVAHASRRRFRSFTDYHPKEWWPDGK